MYKEAVAQRCSFDKPTTLSKKQLRRMFSGEFGETFKSVFFTEHLRWENEKLTL